jgi:hypothetical protein
MELRAFPFKGLRFGFHRRPHSTAAISTREYRALAAAVVLSFTGMAQTAAVPPPKPYTLTLFIGLETVMLSTYPDRGACERAGAMAVQHRVGAAPGASIAFECRRPAWRS